MPMPLFDSHTHRMDAPIGYAVINLPMSLLEHPELFHPDEGRLYSAGIHPLYEGDWEQALRALHWMAEHSQLYAIGECGLDHRNRETLAGQCSFFERQMLLADSLCLPLIIHCVGCWDVLLRLNKLHPPTAPRMVHGFRGKPELASQLLSAGFDLSFGPHFNARSYMLCPPERRRIESDDTGLSIEMVTERQNEWLRRACSMGNH